MAFCHQLNRALKGSIKFNEGDRQEFLLLSFHLLSLRFSFTTVTAGARRDRRLGSARRSVSVAVCSASGILTERKSAQGEPSLWPTFIAAPFILGSSRAETDSEKRLHPQQSHEQLRFERERRTFAVITETQPAAVSGFL